MTNLDAIQEGKTGSSCKGVQHEVELVWSLKSGKIRIYHNRRNVANNLLQQEVAVDKVQLIWKTESGEMLTVVAHAEATMGKSQYNLLVDDVSFYSMPNVVELGKIQTPLPPVEDSSSIASSDIEAIKPISKPQHRNHQSSEHMGSNGSEFNDSLQSLPEHPHDGMGFRLSMVGLNNGLAEMDELRSEVFSPMLESLRDRLVEYLPQTEPLISRSIMQTFFPDYVSQHSEDILSCRSGSKGSLDEKEPQQIEADALFEAYEWAGLLSETVGHTEEDNLEYMQVLIDSVFVKVRNEDISSDEGARILLGVAAVLRLDFHQAIPRDTVILVNMDEGNSGDDLHDLLRPFGELEAVAIATRSPTFGFCRFMSEASLLQFLEAANNGEFITGTQRPRVIPVTETMYSTLVEGASVENKKDEQVAESAHDASLRKNLAFSDSSIPHLMGAWTSDGSEPTEPNMAVVVTPEHHSRSNTTSPRAIVDFGRVEERQPLKHPQECSF